MTLLRSPKHKLLLAGLLIAGLALLSPSLSLRPAVLARVALGLLCVGGLAFAALRSRKVGARFALPSQLEVLARAGLSGKCGVALLEADGRRYLVVHGEGFARVRQTRAAPDAQVLHDALSARAQRTARQRGLS